MSIVDIPPEILALSVPDRIAMVAKIWDSISDESDFGLSDEHKKILVERLAEHHKNPEEGESWEKVKDQLWNDR